MIFQISRVPETLEDFREMLPELQQSPEGAAVACILALKILASNTEAGTTALQLLDPDVARYRLDLAVRQLAKLPVMMNSYFLGTSPEEGYALPEQLSAEFTTNKYSGSPEEGSVKLFTACSGASSSRPVTVRRLDNGKWYPYEWSSLIVGVIAPS
ncbi:hypothetical protein CSA37_05365 [Candidatus Fermentibacteria bacterium]|nr:MAG: hypothetical protein CSA37_05365 [Candidatus Fermentibacteria bacterium]